jgi:hypothetical protein
MEKKAELQADLKLNEKMYQPRKEKRSNNLLLLINE